MLVRRIFCAMRRHVRYWLARGLHPAARIGAACDFRARFTLRMEPGAVVEIGSQCIVDNDAVMEVTGRLRIGARTIFGHHLTLAAKDSVTIGEDCLIAELVSIRDHDHRSDRLDVPIREQGSICRPITIGRNVWIGAKATIAKGVTIGDDAIVGANAVVTKDLPARAIAVGVPAKVIRLRTDVAPAA